MADTLLKTAVIDGGGRGQALAYGLARSSQVSEVLVIPGNGGTEYLAELLGKKIRNVEEKLDTCKEIVDYLVKENVDFVVVGPETWLEKGLGDALKKAGIRAIAPSSNVAVLETDKAWMRKYGTKWRVPQPDYKIFEDVDEAVEYVKKHDLQEGVRKVAYPAGGKGVSVCRTQESLLEAIKEAPVKFGDAGKKFLIEGLVDGVEVSYIGYSDGETFVPWVTSMDHKEIYPGGPMTGGMGVVAPNPYVNKTIASRIEKRIVYPVLHGMKEMGRPYVGFFYAGVMLTKGSSGEYDEPVLLEINARGGDPETLNEMHMLRTDLMKILNACLNGGLNKFRIVRKKKHSVVLVMAAKGYPGKPKTGDVIKGLDTVDDPEVVLFHAGTMRKNGSVLTTGGRVLDVAAEGDSLEEALTKAKSVIGKKGIYFEGMYVREDIGKLALEISK